MHVGRVDLGKEKMSKSLGNVIWVKDFKDDEMMAYRLLVIATPYRNSVNFSNELFDQYKKMYEKFVRGYKQAMLLIDLANKDSNLINEDEKNQFIEYMNNDLNTANVFTLANDILKKMNVSIRNKDIDTLVIETNTLKMIFDVFGLELNYKKLNDEEKALYNEWNDAKARKDFAQADQIREKLIERGLI